MNKARTMSMEQDMAAWKLVSRELLKFCLWVIIPIVPK